MSRVAHLSTRGGVPVLHAPLAALIAVTNVKVNPKSGGLPGSRVLQDMIDGLAFWALLGCVAAMIIGAVVWALASHSNNHHYSASGRRGLLVSAFAALAIGAAAALVNFFAEAGDKVR